MPDVKFRIHFLLQNKPFSEELNLKDFPFTIHTLLQAYKYLKKFETIYLFKMVLTSQAAFLKSKYTLFILDIKENFGLIIEVNFSLYCKAA